MASGALPPAFPAVRIDGELYWDGGILSNTPVEAVFDDKPRRNSLVFAAAAALARRSPANNPFQNRAGEVGARASSGLQRIEPVSHEKAIGFGHARQRSTRCVGDQA
jgi:predicted acylesterase/phospholipase RssA